MYFLKMSTTSVGKSQRKCQIVEFTLDIAVACRLYASHHRPQAMSGYHNGFLYPTFQARHLPHQVQGGEALLAMIPCK